MNPRSEFEDGFGGLPIFHYTLGVAPVVGRIGDHLLKGRVKRALRQLPRACALLVLTDHMTDVEVCSAILREKKRVDGSFRCFGQEVCRINDPFKEQWRWLFCVRTYREDRGGRTSDELLCS